jgi:uncharacterized membrane protein YedE/YeeE
VKRGLVALASGLLFSTGLLLAGMTQPQRILAFLDVFGRWDPSLALVMAGAVSVAAIAFRVAARRPASVFGGDFRLADRRAPIDSRLLIGAALFGVGWGLSGLCPGPAVVSLASGQVSIFVFVLAMIAGMLLHGILVGGMIAPQPTATAHPRPLNAQPRPSDARN